MDTDVEYIDLNNLKLIPTDLNKEFVEVVRGSQTNFIKSTFK